MWAPQQHLSFLIFFASVISCVSGVQFALQMGGDFDLQSNNTIVQPYWDDDYMRLWLIREPNTTHTDKQNASTVGRVVYNHSLPLFDERTGQLVSFNTSFSFQIVTKCAGNGSQCGINALNFSISPQLHPNSSGGNLGIALSPQFNLSDAWVEYIAPLHQIRVFAANSGVRPPTPCAHATYDLSLLFERNQKLYAAISAASATGGAALYSWNFTSEDAAPSPSPSPPHRTRTQLVLCLTLSLLGVLILLAAGCALYRRRKQMFSQRFPAMIKMIPSTGSVPRHSYRELKKATQGFSNKQKLGQGGFSTVYKGTLSTGDVVAVKRMKQGLRMELEFASEIQIISQIRHRNLLQLLGWSYKRGEALLVYQYMPNGSLDSYLFGKKRGVPNLINGEKRFSILVGVAAALEYLHEGLGECVLHRDVKAANVMLTESFEAMLGDFGLARLITHNQVVTMTAAGTPGYVAPEVIYTGRATSKADVYSFGILALEVACGRRALDESLPPEEMQLVDWAWLLQQRGKLMDALDPACYAAVTEQHIEEEDANCTDDSAGQIVIAHKPEDHMAKDRYSLQELKWQCILHVALLCCNPWPADRPGMRQVHQTLRECIVLPLPCSRPTYGEPDSRIGELCRDEYGSRGEKWMS